MINRELIRIKVVQLTYAYYQNGNNNMETAEKELFFSLSKAYDLYNYLLELIVAITQEACRRYEVEKGKAAREGKPMPSAKFSQNKFAIQLEGNRMLNDFMESQKFSWKNFPDVINKLYNQITESQIYHDYMDSDDNSYAADRELWRALYHQLIQKNENIDDFLEEQSLYWNDDKDIVDTFVLKTIKRFDEKTNTKQELLPEYGNDEDRDYARKLFRATILNASEYQRMMSEASRNWDFSRLAFMDIIIMQAAIAEMLTFPSIPISVTINEYINLAWKYSTSRSPSYINGMLDGIARMLIDQGTLLKRMDDKTPHTPTKEQPMAREGETENEI